MRPYDYKYSPASDKDKWMETFRITAGFKYFGGKQFIGKYLMNRLLNMAVRMQEDGKKADIFVDVFTGGGKLGLSVPEGWFDMVVINDLDYGVVSYFESCREKPGELVKTIEKLGRHMNEDMFQSFVYNRCNESQDVINEMKNKYNNSGWFLPREVEPLLAGAMTFWAAQMGHNGCIAPDRAFYRFRSGEEKEEIRSAIEHAKKRIPEISRIMDKRNVIVERLDYRELIKKYNGKHYEDLEGNEYPENEEMSKKNKLWYFDPPYHPATLSGGEDAPYMNTFSLDMVREMTEILHNDKEKDFGELEYFIKSDYNPKYRYEEEYREYIASNRPKNAVKVLRGLQKAYHDFDVLEENDKNSKKYKNEDINYYVECLGDFGKGATDNDGEKATGREYIWCRGNYQGEESSGWKYNGTEPIKVEN